MAGLIVFKSLADALRAGYQVYDRTADGYLVRTRTSPQGGRWRSYLVNMRLHFILARNRKSRRLCRRLSFCLSYVAL